jgi:hypothetical protein
MRKYIKFTMVCDEKWADRDYAYVDYLVISGTEEEVEGMEAEIENDADEFFGELVGDRLPPDFYVDDYEEVDSVPEGAWPFTIE